MLNQFQAAMTSPLCVRIAVGNWASRELSRIVIVWNDRPTMLFPEPRWIVTGTSTIVPRDAMPEPVTFAATILREVELTRIPAGYA